jgi:hypothetical protein
MALVKHPAVFQFEQDTGCEAVTPMGNPFALVDDGGDNFASVKAGNRKPPRLVSADPIEANAVGQGGLKIHRGKFIGVQLALAAADAAEASKVDAEKARDAAIAAKVG